MRKKTMSLKETKTLDEVCSLKRDNFSTNCANIFADHEEVSIFSKRNGGQRVVMSKGTFNQLIDFYNRQQKIIKREN